MLRNCHKCYQVFSTPGGEVCPSCQQKARDDFELVRAYLQGQPAAGIEELHRETGVPTEDILEFIRQGRLKSQSVQVHCQICRAPIPAGLACDECRKRLRRVPAGERVYSMEPSTGEKPRKL
ncbi:MAG TPA: hypothetical protein DCM14_09125 [Clostridiales bacterium UBA8153]|nr:hypothetical protein [Clostridiales bacterium UBA8153]